MTEEPVKTNILGKIFSWVSILAIVVAVVGLILVCCGCTTSVTTITSHGTAEDMVDQQQDAAPNISPTLSIPVK